MATLKQKFSASGIVILVLVAIVAIIFLPRFLVVIDAGEVGVVTLFGKVNDNELSSGLKVKNPFASVQKMDIRTQEYTMSSMTAEGQREGDDSIKALASDGASIWLDVTVFYKLISTEAPQVYKTLGIEYNEKIVRPEIRNAIREIVSGFTVTEIYSEKRTEVQLNILTNLQGSLGKRGIEVEDVLLRDVTLSQVLFDSIEQKLTAQQEAERKEFEIQAEEKEAQRKLIEAQGQRDAQEEINKTLTDKFLYYQYIQSLESHEGTIYVPTEGGLPLFKNVN